MAAAWTGVGVCSPLRRRSGGDRPTGRAYRRSSVAPAWIRPSRAVFAGARRRHRRAPGRGRDVGRPEHSRNRPGRSRSARSGMTVARPDVWRRDTGCYRWHTPRGPSLTNTRQTGLNKDRRPPRQDPVDLVGCPHSTATVRLIRTASPLVRAHCDRWSSVSPLQHAPSCSWRHHHRHRAPKRGVPAEGGKSLAGTHERRPAGVQSPVTSPDRTRSDGHARRGTWCDGEPPGNERRIHHQGRRGRRAGRSKTSEYRTSAKCYASVARSYGASVTEIYSPYATWSKVKAAAQGANLLIYLGHGNGYPSPYGAFQRYTRTGSG